MIKSLAFFKWDGITGLKDARCRFVIHERACPERALIFFNGLHDFHAITSAKDKRLGKNAYIWNFSALE